MHMLLTETNEAKKLLGMWKFGSIKQWYSQWRLMLVKSKQWPKQTKYTWDTEKKNMKENFRRKNSGKWMEKKTNRELQELYKHTSIVTVRKVHRLRWLDQLERMINSRMPKEVLAHEMNNKNERVIKYQVKICSWSGWRNSGNWILE